MATFARRGAMPHHHVPEPKETPPVVHRLRLELNRTVRRRVTEAVDAVCVAFEDDLTHLVTPSVEAVDTYELFYDYCSRLTQFIDNNMDTTPGFLQQMDRLILACHSGASGPALDSVITKNLQIRRRDKGAQMKEQMDAQEETAVTGESEQPAISPGNVAIARKKSGVRNEEGFSDSGAEVAVTVGTTSRQWGTRKRLSTKNYSSMQFRSKRAKRSLISEWRQMPEKEKPGSEEEEKERVSVRASPRHARTTKLTTHPVNCARQVEKDAEEPRRGHSASSSERREAVGGEHGRRIRWNLRSLSKGASTSSELQELDESGEPEPRFSGGQQSQPDAGLVVTKDSDVAGFEQDSDMAETVDVDSEAAQIAVSRSVVAETNRHPFDLPSNYEQGNSGAEKEQHFVATDPEQMATTSNDQSEAESEGRNNTNDGIAVVGDATGLTLSRPEGAFCVTEIVTKRNDVIGLEGENEQSNYSEKAADSGRVQMDEAAPVSDEPDAAVTALNDSECVDGRSIRGASKEEDKETQERMPDEANVLQIPPTDLEELKHSVATEVCLPEATDPQNEGGGQDAPDHEDALSGSDHEPSVPGLCDAGMRPPQQVIHFKACLRKSIQFVDAVLCKPPPGKTCIRNCLKIRSRQCREGVTCRDPLCRNWHQAEAHTERCKNPLCEFRNRILLREIMHQIANQGTHIQLLSLQWEEKCMELVVATTHSSSKPYTKDALAQLHGDIQKLERRIDDGKEESESLKNTRRVILANLSAIGVKPQDDEADGFPDYESHYK